MTVKKKIDIIGSNYTIIPVVATIIVPVCVDNSHILDGLNKCYNQLYVDCKKQNLEIEIIIVNSSHDHIYEQLDKELKGTGIFHCRPFQTPKLGENGKLSNLETGIKYSKGENIIFFDDDARPNLENIVHILEAFKENDIVRSLTYYSNPNFYDCVDMVGIYIVNIVSPIKQFWGNLCFKRHLLENNFFDNKKYLFDELAIERHCRKKSQKFYYVHSSPILMHSCPRNINQFFEQRRRFAYENIAFRMRFIFFLSVIPVLILISFFSLNLALIGGAFLTFIVMLISRIGQKKYGKHNKKIWIYSIFWFWLYPFLSWTALFTWIIGGQKFRHSRIRSIA